jgi:holliday junction DNA helicase RuvA
MYEFIQGEVVELNPAFVVIQTGGIGYFIHISLNTYTTLVKQKQARILIQQIVRDDAHLLYGFATAVERDLFRNLLSVNGVGASTALMMLSSLSPEEVISAIATDNVILLKSVKGIGIKTAQRIIIELKDKVTRLPAGEQILIPANNTIQNEALSALIMLGFARKDAESALIKTMKEYPGSNVETVIKLTLKRL